MSNSEILDQETKNPKSFNKNILLYVLVSMTLLGVYFKQMHWPGSGLLLLIFGGIGVGYSVGLLFYYKYHYFFEIVGLIFYASCIPLFLYKTFNQDGMMLFSGIAVASCALTVILLRGREIR